MKIWSVVLVGVSLGLHGCGDSHDPQFQEMKREMREAVQATTKYAKEQGAKLREQLQVDMQDLEKRLAKVRRQASDKARIAGAAAQAQLRIVLVEAERLRQQLAQRLQQVKDAGVEKAEETWEDIKPEVQQGVEEIKKKLEQLEQKLAAPEAPAPVVPGKDVVPEGNEVPEKSDG